MSLIDIVCLLLRHLGGIVVEMTNQVSDRGA
jgi:hypothetical protein